MAPLALDIERRRSHLEPMTQAQRIPDDSDIELEQLRSAVEEAREEVRRGEGIPHERVREWLLDLAQGKITNPPLPRRVPCRSSEFGMGSC